MFAGGSAKEEAWMLHHDSATAHASLLNMNFWRSMRRVPSPCHHTLQTGPCGLFLVPKVEIHPKRSLISDGRGDRRKFTMGPLRHPTKHVVGHIPELEKMLGALYQQWRRVL